MAFRYGQRINDFVDHEARPEVTGVVSGQPASPVAVFAADGQVVGLAELKDGQLAPSVVWHPASGSS
jgi:hypothetical protein